jgi:hypothetical protein
MKKIGLIVVLWWSAGFLVGGSVYADQTAGADKERAQFKEKLAKAAGQFGPFSNSEDFPKTYFLIPDNLPFMVGLTLNHPKSKTLNLSGEQKAKILEIKKTTVPVVVRTASKIKGLELDLAQQVINNEKPDVLMDLVDQVGSLRIELTKKHLNCIKQVRDILTQEQFESLLTYAGKNLATGF